MDGPEGARCEANCDVAPYMKPLTQMVADYIEHEDSRWPRDWLEIPDNVEVGPKRWRSSTLQRPPEHVDVLVLYSCGSAVARSLSIVERECGLPVTAAITRRSMLRSSD